MRKRNLWHFLLMIVLHREFHLINYPNFFRYYCSLRYFDFFYYFGVFHGLCLLCDLARLFDCRFRHVHALVSVRHRGHLFSLLLVRLKAA
ncbi:hypothetical protein FJT64_027153 [Amphibalanus amphitrite]|uniref:Uncharacterized protein n=1 Tax=Amphibalanus amphitrite TaxID=1232801 RepID=A0A6A4W4T2_AMPAM|nr:hypothetical protein FJT64_027153 [Amphibalanus amphitrite]